MPTQLPAIPLACSALLALLMSGCATEKALTEQTRPLQEQVARLQQTVAADQASALRESQAQAASLAARQAELVQQMAALQAKLQSLDGRLEALAERGTQNESRLNDSARHSAELARQQTTATAAAASNASVLANRLDQTEQRLKALSNLVQEVMAEMAKEVFLANGKEAFTVTLTADKVLYPQNDPRLDPADAAKLDALVARLDTLEQEYHLDIQGHTDNISSDDNNYNLGRARAEVVKRYLHEKKNISISRMSAISYGANKPISRGSDQNRRIFIRVLVLK